jgi:hypothetical protein
LKNVNKWDVYSLSVIYLYIIGNIVRIFSLTQTFLNKITNELLKNIHPEPLKRENMKDLELQIQVLFNNESSWAFVTDLKYNKMDECIRILFE